MLLFKFFDLHAIMRTAIKSIQKDVANNLLNNGLKVK